MRNKELEKRLEQIATIPASQREDLKLIALEFGVSKSTVYYNLHKLNGYVGKPQKQIGKSREEIQAFLQEYDALGFGNRKPLIDKYGFADLRSLTSTVSRYRKMLASVS